MNGQSLHPVFVVRIEPQLKLEASAMFQRTQHVV